MYFQLLAKKLSPTLFVVLITLNCQSTEMEHREREQREFKNIPGQLDKKQIELGWLNRPARRQVDESTLARELAVRDASTHNIWSGRAMDKMGGLDRSEMGRNAKKERSKYRCRPEIDVGKTRGSGAGQMQFCLYFAK